VIAAKKTSQPDASDPQPASLLVKAPEASRMLCISERKLWAMTNAGEIPCVRIGAAVRYSRASLESWIAEQEST
jgi:excisionase family DNA binding protein